jgi:hypothetical protein
LYRLLELRLLTITAKAAQKQVIQIITEPHVLLPAYRRTQPLSPPWPFGLLCPWPASVSHIGYCHVPYSARPSQPQLAAPHVYQSNRTVRIPGDIQAPGCIKNLVIARGTYEARRCPLKLVHV